VDFSVVIPARNEEANIGRCLDSLDKVRREGIALEVIVVDNGSADATVAIARQKGATVYEQPGLRIAALRNFGARRSNGRIIAFLDADCAVGSGWLTAASAYLEREEVAAFGSPAVVPQGGTWVQKAWFNVRGKPDQVVEVEWLESANMLVRRSAFLAVGGFDESLVTCEDYELSQRLRQKGVLVSDHRVRSIHYREPATILEFMKKEMWRGKSNYKGILKRHVTAGEVPSLALPLLYLALLAAATLLLLLQTAGVPTNLFAPLVLAAVILLQLAVAFASGRKSRDRTVSTFCQLFILINLYFLARGVAAVRRN
jgi:cellulose synthase/poly-beta-1,6-N-acetylglucosamine synthase-like glycosyltransferase